MLPAIATFIERLEGWGSPVPVEQVALRRAFDHESIVVLRNLLVPICMVVTLFFICFTATDWLFYNAVFWELLPLRLLLVTVYALAWRFIGRVRGARRTLGLMTVVFGVAMAAIGSMVVINGDPAGMYALPFLVAPAVMALLPVPRLWYALNTAIITLIYALAMVLGDKLGAPGVLNFLLGLVSASVLFAFFHSYLARQRWQSFANRIRAERLTERLAGELAFARRIQQSLLPPARPSWETPDLACWSGPAREVGGDFYAYVRLPDGRIGISVGDVSGKGLPAALLASTCLALLRGAVIAAVSPGALLASLDHALAESTRATRQNCALCCAELSGPTLRVANAGGVPPLVRRASGRVEWVEVGGFPLGTSLSGAGYNDRCAELCPGDTLVLVSDGVVEAMNEADELFGFDRLEAAVAALAADSAFVVIAELREAVAAFIGPADAHDDMTIVALRV